MKTGLPALDLIKGEEVKIVSGVELFAKPDRETVLAVYPYHVLLLVEFQSDPKRFTKIKTTQIVSVCRAALFCGEAKLVRLLDGSPIGRSVCEGGGLDD